MLRLLIFSCEVHKLEGAGSSRIAALFQRLLTSYSAVEGGVESKARLTSYHLETKHRYKRYTGYKNNHASHQHAD